MIHEHLTIHRQALEAEDERLRQTTLATLYTLTFDAPDLISQHLGTLVRIYLKLSKDTVAWLILK